MVKDHLIVREETRCRHIGYSFYLAARVLFIAPSHRQDSTYHSLCYTSCGALAGTRNSSMGPPHEGSIRQPIAPWANALTTELHLSPHDKSQWEDLWQQTKSSIFTVGNNAVSADQTWWPAGRDLRIPGHTSIDTHYSTVYICRYFLPFCTTEAISQVQN